MAVRKIAKVRLSLAILEDLFKAHGRVWRDLLSTAPEDLEVLGVEQPDHAVGQWCYVICRSESFRPIPEAGDVPEIDPFDFTVKGA